MTHDELKARRAELGMTQAQIAERLGLQANSYAKMERGVSNITARTAAAVALLEPLKPAKRTVKVKKTTRAGR